MTKQILIEASFDTIQELENMLSRIVFRIRKDKLSGDVSPRRNKGAKYVVHRWTKDGMQIENINGKDSYILQSKMNL